MNNQGQGNQGQDNQGQGTQGSSHQTMEEVEDFYKAIDAPQLISHSPSSNSESFGEYLKEFEKTEESS